MVCPRTAPKACQHVPLRSARGWHQPVAAVVQPADDCIASVPGLLQTSVAAGGECITHMK